ncbi:MAG: zinc metallopeptidase [Planctomycetota bacterium]
MFDPKYFLYVGPALLVAFAAQLWVKSAVATWSRRPNQRGLTGYETAEAVLRAAGVQGVRIEPSHGFLSDHYDPRSSTLRLSPDVYRGRSVAALAIAAHEAGHAIQHAAKYAPLELRSIAVPTASIGSWISIPLLIAGMILNSPALAFLGILAFSAIVLFQLITLPVEFDASRRAKRVLIDSGLAVSSEDQRGVSAVLTAAAMTYVAAAVQSLATLLYYLARFGMIGGSSNRE